MNFNYGCQSCHHEFETALDGCCPSCGSEDILDHDTFCNVVWDFDANRFKMAFRLGLMIARGYVRGITDDDVASILMYHWDAKDVDHLVACLAATGNLSDAIKLYDGEELDR